MKQLAIMMIEIFKPNVQVSNELTFKTLLAEIAQENLSFVAIMQPLEKMQIFFKPDIEERKLEVIS